MAVLGYAGTAALAAVTTSGKVCASNRGSVTLSRLGVLRAVGLEPVIGWG